VDIAIAARGRDDVIVAGLESDLLDRGLVAFDYVRRQLRPHINNTGGLIAGCCRQKKVVWWESHIEDCVVMRLEMEVGVREHRVAQYVGLDQANASGFISYSNQSIGWKHRLVELEIPLSDQGTYYCRLRYRKAALAEGSCARRRR
jgi:hypothetical protein